MWLACRTGVFTYFCVFLAKQIGKRRNEKTKEEILKKVKNSIIIEEIVNEDIEKQQKVLKTQMKQQKQLIIWKQLLKVTNVTYHGQHTNKAKYLENSE